MTQLGAGLIGIGRKWGVVDSPIPSEGEAIAFLQSAFSQGIRYFDTAPAYAYSEERLGKWFKQLSKGDQYQVTIATKFGEFWDFDKQEPFKNYTFEYLKQSIDKSLDRLERIDILQLHGTTPQVLEKYDDIAKAFEYAKSVGIKRFGASVSDLKALKTVVDNESLEIIQIPHNQLNPVDKDLIKYATQNHKLLVINRPFGMGQLASRDKEGKIEAYRFILKDIQNGIILTGTKSPDHLTENIELFRAAQQSLS